MNELMEKVESLLECLEEEQVVLDIKELTKKIMREEDLLKKIEQYQKTNDERIKEEIIKNPLFREYKKKETDVNLLIMKINARLKEINDKGKCVR